MDDAGFVRGVEGIGELPRDVQRLRDRERPGGEPSGQGVALDELEHQRRLLAVLDHVIDRRDVRVVERCQGTRLALESRDGIGVGRNPRRHELDRHVAPEAHITRPVDFPHAAGSEQRDNLVAADPRAGLQGQTGPIIRPFVRGLRIRAWLPPAYASPSRSNGAFVLLLQREFHNRLAPPLGTDQPSRRRRCLRGGDDGRVLSVDLRARCA